MSLANKHRPKTMKAFCGSGTTIRALESKLNSKEPPRVYLFTGPSGCGKTTLGRIVARHFGSIPKKSDLSSLLDYTELDSADFGGVDMIRNLRKQIPMSPVSAPNKTYLLDECHKLTKDAQEALLKALEEVPEHVVFVLATTNPEKLKITLKRRCLQGHFELSPLTDRECFKLLTKVAKKEKKDVPKKVLKKICADSMGSPGIAIAIFERIMDLSKKDMIKEANKAATESNAAIDLCRAIFKREKWKIIASIIKGLRNDKEDPERVRRAVMGYCCSILLNSGDAGAYAVMDAFQEPFFDTPWEKLTLACYEVWYVED